jgi:hypothetical protein
MAEPATTGSASFVCIPILSSVGRIGVSFQRLDVPGSWNSLSVPIHERPLSPVAWIGHLSDRPTFRQVVRSGFPVLNLVEELITDLYRFDCDYRKFRANSPQKNNYGRLGSTWTGCFPSWSHLTIRFPNQLHEVFNLFCDPGPVRTEVLLKANSAKERDDEAGERIIIVTNSTGCS